MTTEPLLRAFWLTFPKDPRLPMGIGVTAYSREDAFAVIAEQGISWHLEAAEIEVRQDVTLDDLDQRHVLPNIGPMRFRGVWYPSLNLGFGAPEPDPKKLSGAS
jgi:hypothetical protein